VVKGPPPFKEGPSRKREPRPGEGLESAETRARSEVRAPASTSSRIATRRFRSASLILCSSATCLSAVSASGAMLKSMNLAGMPLMRLTRHWNMRSRGLIFLALA
jgi:hypothetical protein